MKGSTYRKMLVNLAVFTVTGIFCVGIAEIVLRLYGITPNTDRMYAYQFDDVLGWTPKKSFKYFRSTPYYAHFNYYNPDGFPTTKPDWPRRADPQKPSVVFLGDSFTEGYYLPYEFTFPYLVGQRLSQQVINLGVSGYAPDQYLLTARQHLPNYDAQMVIVMFFPHNDTEDIFESDYQGYAKPMFAEDFTTPVNLPLPKLAGKQAPENWMQRMAHSSAIYAALRSIVRKYFEMPASTKIPVVLYEYERMQKALRLIKQIQIEFPVNQFVVYYIPMYDELSSQTLPRNLATFQEICTELDLSCFTMKNLLDTAKHPDQYFITGDGHFSKQGAAAVAEHLSTILSTMPQSSAQPR